MNAPHAVWHTDAVRAALESGNAGAIVRAVRQANHWTLAKLAARCGYSVSTLSRLETGKQPLRDLQVLRGLADALRIPSHLLGLADISARFVSVSRPAAMVESILAPDEETDPMRRRTLLAGLSGLAGAAVLGAPALRGAPSDPVTVLESTLLDSALSSGVPTTLPQLRHDVATARATFQQGRYTDVAARLPRLLATAMATGAEGVDENDRADATGQLSQLYVLSSELMVKLGRDRLAWTTADRAVSTAYGAGDDVLTQAAARRAWAIVLRRAGHTATAERQIIDAAAVLQPDLNRGPEYLSVYGSLLSTAAYTAAVDGDRDTAHTLIGEAVQAAGRLGVEGNHRFTAFGPTGVGLYEISIARVLGDSGAAIEVARRINPAAIPLTERQARYWSDVARSYHQWGKPAQCYRALLAAEHASPDEVRYRKPIQEITAGLLHHPTANTLPGLRGFARRAGVPV
ncbi:helix-turn-helix domain-containing protein [Actinoalloteichus hymeniacidonis]|uniref:DNA binding protein with helix-turn-helix domain n=1 Tax=Actinoalloteichus hymeniacidonis TaxID=340345 RepID=A0AAC9HLC3_9PSEU|nr:helix-turn-helix transcriptional regulator [Actinoalloteichus hymeniacidonis]AOS61203.1 DNA binding protein with helix-turn-helix domain [Actinoalloteichus hymeniacidonis]MBB5910795.1 transcriptional regulator with XRE-family HTH domain [Actinoalloteichus hymeniacidonis]